MYCYLHLFYSSLKLSYKIQPVRHTPTEKIRLKVAQESSLKTNKK